MRAGIYTWALLGLVIAVVAAAFVLARLRIVVVPLVLALFPAALLAPPVRWLSARGVPRSIAALLVLVGALGLIVGLVPLLLPAVTAEIPRLAESVQEGIRQLQAFIDREPFGLDAEQIEEMVETARRRATVLLEAGALGVAGAVAQGVAGLLFGIVALFFYLKDGERIAAWIRDLFPTRVRADVEALATRSWSTLAAYFQGQLLVALVDAVFIGIGIALLGVPLAFPLAVLVFLGGLFPIVGAFVSGAVAVLVALADGGLVLALATLAIVVAVQQLESNVLAPVVLGRATRLHPLGVIAALTAGGVTMGVLGAFLAVPVAASLARGIGYLRTRADG